MSFRRYGGIQHSAKNNFVSSNHNTINHSAITETIGHPNSIIKISNINSGNIVGSVGSFDSLRANGFTGTTGTFNYLQANNLIVGSNSINDIISNGNLLKVTTLNVTHINTSTVNVGSVNANSINSLTMGLGGGEQIYNTSIGINALSSNTSGNYNVCVGANAGSTIIDGSNNICIGYNAEPSTANISNQITLGNGSISMLRCNVLGITAVSDARDKKYIVPLSNGLTFVDKLNPVSFKWNMRTGEKVDVPDTGFIAQELQSVQKETNMTIPNLVYDVNPDRLEASYGTLIPILVSAIKELSAKVKALEERSKT
jgi:hypothetical protein